MKPSLALFDFDGTITRKDTFLEFIKFYKGKGNFYIGFLFLSPILVLFKLKLVANWKAKESVLTFFFKGEPVSTFQKKCDQFVEQALPALIRPKAIQQMLSHIKNGDRVIIVSASAENWIIKWARKYNVELIATRLEIKDQLITGKLLGPNCHGPEKVCRINEVIIKDDFETIYAYGDSKGDRELLAYASHPFYRHF